LVAQDWTIKIADFGFSRVKSENHTMTQCGTVAWTAPEIFLGERYSEKADVYSYSVILWELVFRKKVLSLSPPLPSYAFLFTFLLAMAGYEFNESMPFSREWREAFSSKPTFRNP
jgi:serine/threonine protein kinase